MYVLKDYKAWYKLYNSYAEKNYLPLDCVILFNKLAEINIYIDISSSQPYMRLGATVGLPAGRARQEVALENPPCGQTREGRNLPYSQTGSVAANAK